MNVFCSIPIGYSSALWLCKSYDYKSYDPVCGAALVPSHGCRHMRQTVFHYSASTVILFGSEYNSVVRLVPDIHLLPKGRSALLATTSGLDSGIRGDDPHTDRHWRDGWIFKWVSVSVIALYAEPSLSFETGEVVYVLRKWGYLPPSGVPLIDEWWNRSPFRAIRCCALPFGVGDTFTSRCPRCVGGVTVLLDTNKGIQSFSSPTKSHSPHTPSTRPHLS